MALSANTLPKKFGNGLGQLVWGLNSLVNATANIVLSLSLTITLFLSDTGNKVVDSPLWILGIGVCVILGGFANFKATQKENAIFEKWCNSTVWFNRAFTFFGNELSVSPERAKDVRIYKQDSAADRAFQKMEERDKEARARVLRMATCPRPFPNINKFCDTACFCCKILASYKSV